MISGSKTWNTAGEADAALSSGGARLYGILGISIIAVSLASIFIRSCSAPPLTIAFWRMLFSTLMLLPIFLVRYRKEVSFLTAGEWGMMTVAGILLALHFWLWNTSIFFTTIAISTLFVTSHPVMVGIISHLFLGDRLTRRRMAGIGVGVAGILLVMSPGLVNMDLTGRSFIGALLALAGGAAVGGYYLTGRRVRRKVSLVTYVTPVYSIATLVLLILGLGFDGSIMSTRAADWLFFLLLAAIPGMGGHTIHNWLLKRMEAYKVSVALLGEPVGSTFIALFAFHEVPNIMTLVGGAVVLGGIYLTVGGKRDG